MLTSFGGYAPGIYEKGAIKGTKYLAHNEIEGVPVEVVRKRIRRINIRVAAADQNS